MINRVPEILSAGWLHNNNQAIAKAFSRQQTSFTTSPAFVGH